MKYEINEETIAIIPENGDKTRIIEVSNDYVIDYSTFNIMEENCEYYGSTYEGRITAAKKILNFSYKLPLLIEESEKLIFFPTTSATSDQCCWINHNHVKQRVKSMGGTKVTFTNGLVEEFKISKLSFENQLLRASMLDSMISKRIKQK